MLCTSVTVNERWHCTHACTQDGRVTMKLYVKCFILFVYLFVQWYSLREKFMLQCWLHGFDGCLNILFYYSLARLFYFGYYIIYIFDSQLMQVRAHYYYN